MKFAVVFYILLLYRISKYRAYFIQEHTSTWTVSHVTMATGCHPDQHSLQTVKLSENQEIFYSYIPGAW